MVSHLYETLGVSPSATPDEIRRAYRQLALKTHPDKQPQGISTTDKQLAEDKFRKVNAAYEVLSDEEKRRVYDRYGEYPPPEVQQEPYADRNFDRRRRPHAHAHRHTYGGFNDQPFNDPFFSQPFGAFGHRSRAQPFQGFSDPFALFDQIFGDMQRQFEDPFFGEPHQSTRSPFGPGPFGHSSLFDRMMGGSPFGMLPAMNGMFDHAGGSNQGRSLSFSSSSSGMLSCGPDGNTQWVSQSKMTRTVNGVTESVWKRTDSNGNEHVTYSYPNGREKYLINGVEQPSGRQGERSLPPPPPYPGPPAPINTSRRSSDRGAVIQDMNHSPTSPYGPADMKYGRDYDRERRHGHREHRPRHGHENREYYDNRNDHHDHSDHHKKRWWKGEW